MTRQDLFTWRDEAEAAEWVRAAEAERMAAERARRYAPHGEVRARQARLEAATAEALRAEIYLRTIQRQGRP